MTKDVSALKAMVIGYEEILARLSAITESMKKHGSPALIQHWGITETLPIGIDAVKALSEYYRQEIKNIENQISLLGNNNIENAECNYVDGVWQYSAKFGPCWLIGNINEFIHAYDRDVREDPEAKVVDDFIKIPTWKSIVYSIRRDVESDVADECVYNIKSRCIGDLDFPCNL